MFATHTSRVVSVPKMGKIINLCILCLGAEILVTPLFAPMHFVFF